MQYLGLSTDDLDNIRALNGCFLKTVPNAGYAGSGGLSQKRLSESQQARLGCAPFLLFSFRENEPDYWQQVLSGGPQLQLLPSERPLDARTRDLQVSGLSFLWQLAGRNPYAVRIVSGAPPSWCEQVTALPVVTFLRRTRLRADMLVPRFCDQEAVWERLLKSGISPDAKLRAMSHQSALQAMLAGADPINQGQLQVAAASSPRPGQKKQSGTGNKK